MSSCEIIRLIDEWRYRIEGSANLILEYVGRDQRFHGKILRIRKRTRHNEEHPSSVDIETDIKYEAQIHALLRDGNPAHIKVRSFKIVHMHGKDIKNVCSIDWAISSGDLIAAQLMEDVMSPLYRMPDLDPYVMSIEMKPKWPYEPGLDYNGWCMSCLNRFIVKDKVFNAHVRHEEPRSRDSYCPSRFFSSIEAGSFEIFCANLDILLRDTRHTRYFINQMLTGIEAYRLFESKWKNHTAFCGADTRDKRGDLSRLISRLLFKSRVFPCLKGAIESLLGDGNNIESIRRQHDLNFADESQESPSDPVTRYLMSRTLRDCSIIITIQMRDPRCMDDAGDGDGRLYNWIRLINRTGSRHRNCQTIMRSISNTLIFRRFSPAEAVFSPVLISAMMTLLNLPV